MIGDRVRALRQERDWTLRQLAEATGTSTGLLSQVERGINDPSLETLRRLAAALDVPLFGLFAMESAERVAVVRADRRRTVRSPHGGISYTRVSPGAGRLEVLEGELPPGAASAPQPHGHPSEECVVVCEGVLLAQVDEAEYRLEQGDSCYFDSRLPHRYVNPTETTTRFLVSITPPSY